ncbi:carboxylesterase family protein [Streptomyces sp. B1866]|uniref:carboxylesterase/lipase family protein n=1 Tax=Streptomyces sp. B1866 TaxID=3075431 RepID=UPI00289216EF|nr:carboxylesterase family protein [Streptomyces sp. B1866]MDT3397234.1 carboxylesterase family protein [Streptomyces sp. B1866]
MLIKAKTSDGVLRGRVEDGVTVFRGVRYATGERFGPPRPVPAWTGERDATTDGPIAPQRPSRLEPVMGVPEQHEQGEDCLNLTIATPGADDRARPVLVWFHGGAWISGAGSWKCYGGHRLAREGDVVVVSVSYRLGVLGYLRAPGISPGNLGLADQLAALRWVRDNIAAFGGDPDAVTVAGQSAGAHTVQCLLGMPEAEGLFRRAIIQSSPGGIGLGSARTAERAARRFLDRLGTDPRTASTADILAAQSEVARHAAGRLQLNTAPQFTPVAGVGPLPDEAAWAACLAQRAPAVDVIVGTTAREASAFYALNPALRRLRRIPALGPAAADAVERAVSTAAFDRPARHLATRLAKSGARVWTYRFDYSASGSPFGAPHCIELPFLFGTDADWATAPMLAGAHPDDLDTLGRRLRTAWLGFIRTGAPTADTRWPQFTADTRATRHWHL